MTVDVYLTPEQLDESLRADARRGLTSSPKWLSPTWLYDARGGELFDRITRLPEYYPTRTERALLQKHSPELADEARPEMLVELGSGSSEKTEILLDALQPYIHTYVPQDVSEAALQPAVTRLSAEYPDLTVRGVVGDFTGSLAHLPGGGRRMIAFLGGTIGNLAPAERAAFLTDLAAVLEPGEWLLLGIGLVTDPDVLVPAYDDAAGVTAEFDRNVLNVLNNRLGADFEPGKFRHVAVWDPINEWIEMRLEATEPMTVRIPGLDLEISFAAGEQLRTEISAKFRLDGMGRELTEAGFVVRREWIDPDGRFALIGASRA
ncbi:MULTISPECIES: L-histidine N(alpha)-methyltransferase [Rhodococcus]|uniref:Histidine N-alpha-methyltransferase n=1 Tax=Rhodococcus aetherivorans TaxID=191292 RepID=A0ABQ0YTP3_9NOCA|nr:MULTISPECIES: L-histidine N(alpha)-methyltransferase [Rhodococcus]ETT25467.1 methyltransferase [Rhodococcus rhodochrous ATCC 21198]AKE89075.1 histidyl-tRNA synthetase [Rhodococcus aetherivorans]NGP24650.1 L-histidine N(alpha)-methyltransferase [Rhodococcus aetherivorans]QRI75458.1 L-histidine N(alpha)-methyltransferase [Rhodococcus aetherivorans]QSE58867.1 L-histidine N(alpha)-methyltransferase [Rhodococcus sp. PSBB066]